jgi:enoyl-CoA hydratase/carnithine racemase
VSVPYEFVLYEKQGDIVTITQNRPERLNSFSLGLLADLIAALTEFEDDPEAKVAILTGNGRGFSTGWDRKEHLAILEMPDGKAKDEALAEEGQLIGGALDAVRNSTKPIIAAVNGYAVGGGVGLVTGCVYRIAAENATFFEPGITLGPGGGGRMHTSNYVGGTAPEGLTVTAMSELALGMKISGRRAYEVGLVTKVVPENELMSAAMEAARYIADLPEVSVRNTLQNLRNMYKRPDDAMATGARWTADSPLASEAARESARAFAEKRQPVFESH